MNIMWFYAVLCVCFFVFNVNAQSLGGYCRTPSGEAAKCINVYDCAPLISLLRSPSRTPEQTKFLSNSRCGFDSSGTPYVCCGSGFNRVATTDTGDSSSFSPNPSIPDRTGCGWQATNKIFGGEQTALDEFPWMAVIQYLKPNGRRVIACGGSLINNRYILTAAHCVVGEVLVKVGQPVNVRLGEYDTSSPGSDCLEQKGKRFCNQQEINAGIQEILPHPGYTTDNNRMNDIALIRLNRDIPYSDYIQPVCLPLATEASRTGEQLVVAGWGKTEKGKDSNVKLKLKVPVTDTNSCANVFRAYSVQIGDSQICAGAEDGRDSCTGDSGGPLMRTLPTDDTRWMIEGLVSFGYNQCGRRGYPGVYTRVAKYLSWIHRNVKP